MITYCLGDIKAKRAAFRAAEVDKGQLSIDNDEILIHCGKGRIKPFSRSERFPMRI